MSGSSGVETKIKDRQKSINNRELLDRQKSINNRELLIAAGEGSLNKVKDFIKKGADVDFVDRDGNTALNYAIESGDLEVVHLLLDKVEDVSIENNKNKTPLNIAMESGKQDIIKEIEEQIVNNSLKIFEELLLKQKELSDNKTKDLTFIGATFSRDYTKPLTHDDINNILKFKYIKKSDKEVFEAIPLRDLKDKLTEYKLNKESMTFIIDLGNLHWVTLVIPNSDTAYYVDSLEKNLPDDIKNISPNVIPLTVSKKINKYDSGIFALKNAEIIKDNLNDKAKLEKELKEYKLIEVEERELFANILNEKKRTEDKIKSCLGILKNLNRNADTKSFSYENANVFVLFLETFALEDTYSTTSGAAKKEQSTLGKDLQKLKKEYFSKYYFQPKEKNSQEKPDIRLISDARSSILHGSKILKPEDLSSFIVKGARDNISDFFKNLEQYTEYIHKKITDNKKDESINCNSFLAHLKKKESIGREGDLSQVFSQFVQKIHQHHRQIQLEEMLFDLTVNIIPVLDKEKEKIRELSSIRNNLIHSFQDYPSPDTRLREFRNVVCSLKSLLFKHYYSKKIHDVLKNTQDHPGKDSEKIKADFDDKLKNFEEQFKKDYGLESIIPQEEAEGTFEYKFSQSLFPEKDENIKELVCQYLKFMIIIGNEEREEENQIDGEEEESKTSEQYKELSSVERREIFEEFIKLKQVQKYSDNEYKEKQKKELKAKLKNEYGIREDCFNEIVELYIESDKELDQETTEKGEEITNILNTLKKIKKDYQFSNRDITHLYKRFVKEKSIFDLDKYQDLLKSYNLVESQKQSIQEKFGNLPKAEIIDISIGMRKVKINTFQVISNMLEVFYNSYNKYQIKFNNVEEAFNDKMFLDYLISRDVKQEENQDTGKEKFQFQDSSYIFMIIKKLLKIDYTAPYIAGLIIKVQNDKVIEKDDLIKLIEILLEKDLYIVHLDKLLHIKSKKFKLHEEVCNKILEKKDINIESMHAIFKESEHVKKFLNILKERVERSEDKEKVGKLIKEILKLLNSVAYELHRNGSYDDVLKILDNKEVKEVQKQLTKNDDLDVLEAKYQIARTKNQLGRRKEQSDDKDKLFKEALDILIDIQNTITSPSRQIRDLETPRLLLTLAEITYTKSLLKKYDEAYKEDEILYKKVIRFALNIQDDIDIKENEYSEFKDIKKYESLLTFSDESKKYLDVLNIKSSMAYSRVKKGELENYKEALEIYEKVYSKRKGSLGLNKDITKTMNNIAFLNNKIGTLLLKSKDYIDDQDSLQHYQNALHYYHEGLIKYNKVYKSQKEMLLSSHPATLKSKRYIVKNLCNVAYTYNKLGKAKKVLGEWEYREALEIYKKVYDIQKNDIELQERDLDILTTMRDIAFTYDILGTYEENKKELRQALQNYEKAHEMYNEVYKVQKKEKHEYAFKTEKRIQLIKKKIERLE